MSNIFAEAELCWCMRLSVIPIWFELFCFHWNTTCICRSRKWLCGRNRLHLIKMLKKSSSPESLVEILKYSKLCSSSIIRSADLDNFKSQMRKITRVNSMEIIFFREFSLDILTDSKIKHKHTRNDQWFAATNL